MTARSPEQVAHKIAAHLCDFGDTGKHDETCSEIAQALHAVARSEFERARDEAEQLLVNRARALSQNVGTVSAAAELLANAAVIRALSPAPASTTSTEVPRE